SGDHEDSTSHIDSCGPQYAAQPRSPSGSDEQPPIIALADECVKQSLNHCGGFAREAPLAPRSSPLPSQAASVTERSRERGGNAPPIRKEPVPRPPLTTRLLIRTS